MPDNETKPAHTPGPWHHATDIDWGIIRADDVTVARCGWYLDTDEAQASARKSHTVPPVTLANALLISAAPELLEAGRDAFNLLKAVDQADCDGCNFDSLCRFDDGGQPTNECLILLTINSLFKAIAKATGEPHA